MCCAGWEKKSILLLFVTVVASAANCPLQPGQDLSSQGPGSQGPSGNVILRIENQSGLPAVVTARFSIDDNHVRETVRRLASEGNESIAELLPTRARVLEVTAVVGEDFVASNSSLVQPGSLLREGRFLWQVDFGEGDTLVFVIPSPETPGPELIDCNSNGIQDALDISNGTSTDCNSNGVPDECDICDEGIGIGIPNIEITPSSVSGPVLIGGDDTDGHGYFDQGANQFGWSYIEKAFDHLGGQVRNRNKRAVCLGCSGPPALEAFKSGFDHSALPGQGWERKTIVGEASIADFFDGVGAVTIDNTGILYLPTNAENISGGITQSEMAVVNQYGLRIHSYVDAGGGLFTHDQDTEFGGFGWLTAMLPGLVRNEPGLCNDVILNLTAEGSAAFPSLDDSIMSVATPWHGWFSGDLGDLQALMTAPCTEGNVAVIIGSPSVPIQQFAILTPFAAINPLGDLHVLTAQIANELDEPIVGTLVTFNVVDGPNQGVAGQSTTGANGRASFSYSGNGGSGRDEIVASFFDGQATQSSNSAFKFWLPPGCSADCNENGVPDECEIASSPSSDANSNGLLDACESQPTTP